MEDQTSPDFILYAQHGWADNHRGIAKLAKRLAEPETLVITPGLGFIKTWFWIEPLIEEVEQQVNKTISDYPGTPIRVIGHSMGGLIWLEVLARHPEWRTKIHSLVLIASPVGGADLARMLDPLGIGVGIARDLSIDRRSLAEQIAQEIPTLAIAGDLDSGSDGTIPVESTKFAYSKFVSLPGISHAEIKNHPSLTNIIHEFWQHPTTIDTPELNFATKLIEHLRSVPGMTDGHRRDFCHSKALISFENGVTIRTWKNLLRIEHVFVADRQGECLYSGFVGWLHKGDLYRALGEVSEQSNQLISGE